MAKKTAAVASAPAKPKAKASTSPAAGPQYFIIAQNRAHAKNEAEHELGWKSDGNGGWIDKKGNAVAFLTDPMALKTKKGVFVYRAYRWYSVIAPHLFDKLVEDGCCTVVTA